MDRGNRGSAIHELRNHLASLPPGPVPDCAEVEALLAACWDVFKGSNAEGMAGSKLCGRMDEVTWQPPVLRFTIDRHGGTVLGSTRAERHQWCVDLDAMVADCAAVGHRQLHSQRPRLDVRPIVDEITRVIANHQEDERLSRYQDGSVRVLVGKILPKGSAVAQTLQGRRRRFRDALDERMRVDGWVRIRADIYGPPSAHASSTETTAAGPQQGRAGRAPLLT